ncbi:histone H3-like protein [Mycena indigotica]|uniref:Histone H4 n=1 Tax=Mycena indigotica TaxID=2126181 RepID=A0A8H6SD89_9AGAR|nr:histone H3-like protein [Mycena indigotica]KAF7296812.1 histone H3-like protein [Mycena indigotica]
MARTIQKPRVITGGKTCGRRAFYTAAQRRRNSILQDAALGISRPSLRRLARRGGVKRSTRLMYDDSRAMLRAFLRTVVHDAALYAGHAYRSTVTPMDVQYALKKSRMMLYT